MDTFLSIVTVVAIYSIATAGLRVQVGEAGLINFGIAAYFGVGAYAYAIFSLPASRALGAQSIGFGRPSWEATLISIGIVLLVGALTALPILHLDAVNFALVTFAYLVLMSLLLTSFANFADGSQGLSSIHMPMYAYLSQSNFRYTGTLCAVALIVLVVVSMLVRRLQMSPLGTSIRWQRDDSIGASSGGVSLVRVRLQAYTVGCLAAGIGGILFSWYTSSAAPDEFTISLTFSMFIAMMLGGVSSYLGPIIGGVILFGIEQFLATTALVPSIASRLAYIEAVPVGIILILLLRLRPDGIMGRVGSSSLQALDAALSDQNSENRLERGQREKSAE